MDKGKTGHRRKAAAAGMLQVNFLAGERPKRQIQNDQLW